jgi:regulator of nonsense transcripts 1
MNNDCKEFIREEDNANFDNYIDAAFLEYGTDDEKEVKGQLVGEILENNPNNEQLDDSYRQELEDELDELGEGVEKEMRCAYCGILDQKNLVKCNEKDCQRWFCNGRKDDYSASHIVFHLTKSKHKEVYVSDQSAVGEMVLECYNCSSKNIFLLGFLESKEGDSGFILCREPCLTTSKIEEDKFDKTKWVPLINDKKLMDWIVPSPAENDFRLCSKVGVRTMSKLEEKWEKEKLKVNQEKPKFLEKFLKSVKLCYNDGQDYLETFEPLISAEEEYDRKLKESQKKYNVNIAFFKSGRRYSCKFMYPREDNGIFSIIYRD